MLVLLLIAIFSCRNSSNEKAATDSAVQTEIVEVKLRVSGMHCEMCEQSVNKGVKELEGIEFVEASLADSMATVRYDKSKTNESEISAQIEKRGYKVKGEI